MKNFPERFGRLILVDEVVFDVDKRGLGFTAINEIAFNLYKAGHSFEIWFAEGQKSPHLHLKEIDGLENLGKETLSEVKKLILDHYTPKKYKLFIDKQLAHSHRIVKENSIHYKYGAEKKLLLKVKGENLVSSNLIKKAKEIIKPKQNIKVSSGKTGKIVSKLSILNIARSYGFELRGYKASCKFHADSKPSLSFNDAKGWFICFGCNLKGNIVDFLALCKEHNFKRDEAISWQR